MGQPSTRQGSTGTCQAALFLEHGLSREPNIQNWPGTVILHSRADDVVPFADSEELVGNSGLSASALIEVGNDHRLADPEPLTAMLRACELRGESP
jgi:hypothetical protein